MVNGTQYLVEGTGGSCQTLAFATMSYQRELKIGLNVTEEHDDTTEFIRY